MYNMYKMYLASLLQVVIRQLNIIVFNVTECNIESAIWEIEHSLTSLSECRYFYVLTIYSIFNNLIYQHYQCLQMHIQNPFIYLRWNYFQKEIILCLTGFWISVWPRRNRVAFSLLSLWVSVTFDQFSRDLKSNIL